MLYIVSKFNISSNFERWKSKTHEYTQFNNLKKGSNEMPIKDTGYHLA